MALSQTDEVETNQDKRSYGRAEDARTFGKRLLLVAGLPEADAVIVADCLVRADLRGVDTHGLQLLPHYLKRVRLGLVNPRLELAVEQITPVAGALDGQNAFGFLVATRAMARSEEHTSELQSLMRISYAVFCLKKKN